VCDVDDDLGIDQPAAVRAQAAGGAEDGVIANGHEKILDESISTSS
jgi:hypothetical protein